MTPARGIRYRARPRRSDAPALRRLVAATGVFYAEERAVALELLEIRLEQGPKSGYAFIFAERGPELLGYAAWGKAPLTQRTFDLYWIAVAPEAQGSGVGRALLERVERAVAGRGGGHLYIETSSRAVYARTRRFYREAGYRQVARLRDFYAAGDDKVMFCKLIAPRKGRNGAAGRARRAARSRAKEIL
jgi:ribosomal protein S18 acetylase RimI-like enzyme